MCALLLALAVGAALAPGDAVSARALAQDRPAAASAAVTVTIATEQLASPVAPAAPPAASTTQPSLVANAQINAGDTAWMLTSTALVLMMTVPGLALFYGGMVRRKNVLSTLMQSFAITCLVTILWWVAGYSLALTPGHTPYIGGLDRLFLRGMSYVKDVVAVAASKDVVAVQAVAGQVSVSHLATTIPESVYAMFQLTFAIITPALICGAFAERMKFSAMLWFMGVWSILVYAPVAHWVWEPGGWLAARGVLDFAGGTVVHINAGIAALACALVLGKRVGYNKEPMMPHNLVLTVIGAALLWVGWFGFNAGSAVAADGRAGMAMAVTQIATAAAALAWMFCEWIAKGKPSVLGIASGAVAGLVAITPASGYVGPTAAVLIGVAGGIICFVAATSVKRALGYDDALDAFGVHCVGGIVGALLTGVLADPAITGGVSGSLLAQLIGVVVTLVYSFVLSLLILKVIDLTIGLRVNVDMEREGLDVALHGESVAD